MACWTPHRFHLLLPIPGPSGALRKRQQQDPLMPVVLAGPPPILALQPGSDPTPSAVPTHLTPIGPPPPRRSAHCQLLTHRPYALPHTCPPVPSPTSSSCSYARTCALPRSSSQACLSLLSSPGKSKDVHALPRAPFCLWGCRSPFCPSTQWCSSDFNSPSSSWKPAPLWSPPTGSSWG